MISIQISEPFDIPVYDSNDTLYNIGDLLNMPYFWAGWKPINNLDEEQNSDNVKNLPKLLENNKHSILYNYYTTRPYDEVIPNVDRIRRSVDQYIDENKSNDALQESINIVSHDKTLTVHIRSGDKSFEIYFIDIMNKVSENYDKIVILSGVHATADFEQARQNLNASLELAKEKSQKELIINFEKPDIHLSLMRSASNLLLHKGGFSILGGLLFHKNNLYIPSAYFEPVSNDEYMKYVEGNIIYL